MKFNKKYVLYYIILLFFLCLGFTHKPLQNDVFYMLKLGKDILKYGIDMKDHYSFIANLGYTYPHWLYDIYIYYIYKLFSFLGVFISSFLFYFLLISIIFFVILNKTKNYFYSFLCCFVASFCVSFFVSGRSLLLTTILFFLEVYFITKLINTGSNKYIIFLVFGSLLIANLHATVWLFYFILFLPFFAKKLVFNIVNKYSIKYNKKLVIDDVDNMKKLLISFGCCFFIGIFSPSRICYTYVFRIMLGNTQSFIQEHAPLVVIHEPMFLILIIFLLFALIFSKCKIKIEELFMLCGLIFMSLLSQRHLIFLYTIGLVYISFIVFRYLKCSKNNSFDILDRFIFRRKIVFIFIFVFFAFFSLFTFIDNFSKEYISNKIYPVDAVKYIKSNLEYRNIRIYNYYNYGSYLLFNDIPVFIDSRCDLYLKEFNGKVDFFTIDINASSNYKKVFKKYNIDYVLVDRDDALRYILENDVNYDLIYHDKYFSIYHRN